MYEKDRSLGVLNILMWYFDQSECSLSLTASASVSVSSDSDICNLLKLCSRKQEIEQTTIMYAWKKSDTENPVKSERLL